MQNIPVLVIFAPTASGKTALVGNLFSDNSNSILSGKAEIINADSMQVYRGMDIGTAKPDGNFLKHLPHHLIDLCSPKDQYGVGEFIRDADLVCKDIFWRKKLPVVCGGTAFYIRNFMYGLPKTPKADLKLRENLKKRMEQKGALEMMKELEKLDPVSAKRIHLNDEYRILRALEVCIASGKPLSYFELNAETRPGYDFYTIELQRPREELYTRIDMRVDQMFDMGLADEFNRLKSEGYNKNDPGMEAIGYREFFMADDSCLDFHDDGEQGSQQYIEQVKDLIKRDSRHYAKRQVTFFAPMKDVERFPADNIEEIEKKIIDFASKYALI